MAQAIPDVSEDMKTVRQKTRPDKQGTSHVQQVSRGKRDDNIIYIGKKPTMSYVLAVMTQMQNNVTEIHVKARGRSISRAVDVVEVVRNRFLQDIKRDITIGTETINSKDRGSLNVSTIDIRMMR